MVEGVSSEIGFDATVGGECLVFESLVVDKLGFVDE